MEPRHGNTEKCGCRGITAEVLWKSRGVRRLGVGAHSWSRSLSRTRWCPCGFSSSRTAAHVPCFRSKGEVLFEVLTWRRVDGAAVSLPASERHTDDGVPV